MRKIPATRIFVTKMKVKILAQRNVVEEGLFLEYGHDSDTYGTYACTRERRV